MDPQAANTPAAGTSTDPGRRKQNNRNTQAKQGDPSRPPKPRQPRPKPSNETGASSAPSDAKRRPRDRKPNPTTEEGATRPRNARARNFGAGLTQPADEAADAPKPSSKPKGRRLPQGDDLTSSLIRQMSTPPYPDCPICFSEVKPEQAIWSCSPSIPIVTSSEAQVAQYCWTSFHIRCIRSWAEKSVKEIAEAYRARGETDKKGDWRCPGCQAKRETVPSGYWCFCNSVSEPKPFRLSTPHSCGNSCSRTRESGCGHPCPLKCHPGPCPPCQVTTRLPCYCPKQNVLTFHCGVHARGQTVRDLSCGEPCQKTLNCGKHKCDKICHPGECGGCEVEELVKCWCGKEEKTVFCGEGEEVQCFVEGEQPWIGRYGCDEICERPFNCGIHKCEKSCHSPSSKPAICPRSPSKVTACPCGKSSIAPSPNSDPSQYAFPARTNCTDRIPTCTLTCSKPHPGCSHPCKAKCHEGPCPPCRVEITRPCRCGAKTKTLHCFEVHVADTAGAEEKEILCDKPCLAYRACGHHQCRRLCCPLASMALTANKKGKRRAAAGLEEGIGEERGGLHECDLVCGKMLSCGNHKCEMRDHKNVCPPCLRSSFEELICPCGRTIYEPPIPCGTKMQCHYPCARPPPECGHPHTPHSCHADSVSCPPCVHLAEKQCACGKKVVPNVRCSLETEKVSCGTVCGKLMSCGFHLCNRLCHGDDCGACTSPCGKARKSCPPDHPCTLPCHAPSACPETDLCQALVTLSCPCGRIRQAVRCGKTITTPGASQSLGSLKCSNDCEIAKRNARLADALGINTESRDKAGATATYTDDLVAFAKANSKFLPTVERAFSDFITSDKRTQVLPQMPPDRRKFVHDLAAVYRMDAQMVDQEPHRSVQLLRRIDTRIPTPVLSAHLTTITPSYGKLADFRSLRAGAGSSSSSTGAAAATSSWRSAPPAAAKPPTQATASRGWTSVVAASPGPTSTSAAANKPSPYAWGARPVASNTPAASSLARLGGSGHNTPAATSRSRTPVNAASQSVPQTSAVSVDSSTPVPENWEDDV